MRSVEVLVAGGGASGMMAAITAKRQGANVMIVEKKPKPGKKLLATGNGKCNFTNLIQEQGKYYSDNKEFPWKVIQRFGAKDSIEWFQKIGVLEREREGYVYPASNQASSVVNSLIREMKRLKIEVHTEEIVREIRPVSPKGGFQVVTDKSVYLAKKVIIATGGMASPVHGSSGDGYELARSLGHQVISPVPALTSLRLQGKYMKTWAGCRVQGKVTLYHEKGEEICREQGEIQLVAYGISGIPVFQISRFAAKEIQDGKRVTLVLDAMPQDSEESLIEFIEERKQYDARQSVGDVLEGILPDKFARAVVQRCHMDMAKEIGTLSLTEIHALVSMVKHMECKVEGVSDFDKAQVTAGGVSTKEVNPLTMESVLEKGIYFTGEVLDVDGVCGGYNLQWAWASGYAAGTDCHESNGKRKDK